MDASYTTNLAECSNSAGSYSCGSCLPQLYTNGSCCNSATMTTGPTYENSNNLFCSNTPGGCSNTLCSTTVACSANLNSCNRDGCTGRATSTSSTLTIMAVPPGTSSDILQVLAPGQATSVVPAGTPLFMVIEPLDNFGRLSCENGITDGSLFSASSANASIPGFVASSPRSAAPPENQIEACRYFTSFTHNVLGEYRGEPPMLQPLP